jgi:four helix bundle protein
LIVGGSWLRGSPALCHHRLDCKSQFLRTSPAIRPFWVHQRTAREMRASRLMLATTSFRQLDVWKEAMTLVEEIYRVSSRFPSSERFGLTAQLRRATVSVPSNIGEAARRKRRKAYLFHLDVALGSQAEVDVQLEIARRLALGLNYQRLTTNHQPPTTNHLTPRRLGHRR